MQTALLLFALAGPGLAGEAGRLRLLPGQSLGKLELTSESRLRFAGGSLPYWETIDIAEVEVSTAPGGEFALCLIHPSKTAESRFPRSASGGTAALNLLWLDLKASFAAVVTLDDRWGYTWEADRILGWSPDGRTAIVKVLELTWSSEELYAVAAPTASLRVVGFEGAKSLRFEDSTAKWDSQRAFTIQYWNELCSEDDPAPCKKRIHCRGVVDSAALRGRCSQIPPFNSEFQTRHDKASRILARHPDDGPAHLALAELYDEQNRVEEALEHYRRAAKFSPESFDAHYRLAVLLTRAVQPDEAIDELKKALALKPDDAHAHYQLAWVLAFGKRRMDEARREYQTAISLDPGNAEFRNNLGFMFSVIK